MPSFDDAHRLWQLGWNVLPAAKKLPTIRWKQFQNERVTEKWLREAFANKANVFIITGKASRLLVLDCDDDVALRWWRERLGDEVLGATTQVRTSRGFHFYFQLEQGVSVTGYSNERDDESGKWDVRCEGGGVIAPPSIHESGRVYRWVDFRGPGAIQPCPAFLLVGGSPKKPRGGPRNSHSMLAHLLENPPGEGERNNWLTKVAGHLAKHIPHEDAYEALVLSVAPDGLDDAEVAKLVLSIWNTEHGKLGRNEVPSEDNAADWQRNLRTPSEESGWLVSGNNRILVQVRSRNEHGGYEFALQPWMDADVQVRGTIRGEHTRSYRVVLHPSGREPIEDIVDAGVIADYRKLSAWLSIHGVSIGPPDEMYPSKIPPAARLTRYLEIQDAETMETVSALGWHKPSRAFITHEGLIRAGRFDPYESVCPAPKLKGWAPYRYGHASTERQAREVLRTIMEFHDETVTAVFGSWWASCFLKPQVLTMTSQFPFMALEAASESGKTTGFFSLMLQLSGNSSGQMNPTKAALRDYLCAHKSGIVWMDDLDDLSAHGELLRNVTVGGAMVKKGEDHDTQVSANLNSALVITGESLGLRRQKALVDRAILLEVPSPTSRMGRTGISSQWDDILEIKHAHPDLTEFAGTLVQMSLAREPQMLKDLKVLRRGTSRYADKLAIVRSGARLLAYLTDDDSVVERAEAWAIHDERFDTGAENALTLKLLPLALGRTGWRNRPFGPEGRADATPCFLQRDPDDQEIVWFSPRLLASWWEREPPLTKRIEPRTESAPALEQQARALGLGGSKGTGPHDGRRLFRYATGEGNHIYWKIPADLSDVIIGRSQDNEFR